LWLYRHHDGRRPRFGSWTHSRLALRLVGTLSAKTQAVDSQNALASDARVCILQVVSALMAF